MHGFSGSNCRKQSKSFVCAMQLCIMQSGLAEGKKEEDMSEKCECQKVKGERIDGHFWECVTVTVTDQPTIEGWVMENRPVKTILKVVRDEVERVGLGSEMGDQREKEIAQSLRRVYQKSEYEGWTWDKVKAWKKDNLSEDVWATKVDKGKGKIMKACKWKYMRRVIREVMGEKGAVVGVAHKKKTYWGRAKLEKSEKKKKMNRVTREMERRIHELKKLKEDTFYKVMTRKQSTVERQLKQDKHSGQETYQ